MAAATPCTVVVAGGGPAALEAVLALAEHGPAIQPLLLAEGRDYVCRPLSVMAPFGRAPMRRYPYAVFERAGVRIRRGSLLRVGAAERAVWTTDGARIPYDALLVATGAQQRRALARCLTFGGPADIERMHQLVTDVEHGYVRSLAFVAPPGASWTLPLYELALQTAERIEDAGLRPVETAVVSHERRPLEIFGASASALMENLLRVARIRFVRSEDVPDLDRVVALPGPAGHHCPGLPSDGSGFVPVDAQGRVEGVPGVWAAGDCTAFPIKQGGLATQQADVAAASIALSAGVRDRPLAPGAPVLRAMFVARGQTHFLMRRLDGTDPGQASRRALWWPPAKISGDRLAPFLEGAGGAGGPRQPAAATAG